MLFAEMAARAFSFLENMGFQVSRQANNEVIYEAPRTRVVITWDPYSGELDAYIGLQSEKENSQQLVSLADVLAMQGIDKGKMPFQVANEDGLFPFLNTLAEELRAHAQLALVGDLRFFRRLKKFRTAQANLYMRDMHLKAIRNKANEAWRRKDLQEVVKLYAAIRIDLTESEKKKLAYARQHYRKKTK